MLVECLACGATSLIMRSYPVGNTSGNRKLIDWESLPVASCTTCGYSWVTEVPDNLDEYYEQSYSAHIGRNLYPPPEEYYADPAAQYRPDRSDRHAALIRRHTPRLRRILDIGAGLGTTLSRFDGAELLAIEPDPAMHPYLRHIGAELTEQANVAPASIDVVISSHHLEHVPPDELLDLLGWVRKVIRPGGTLLVEVPHASLLRFETSHVRHDPHLSFFSIESLDRLVQRAGFDTVELGCGAKKKGELLEHPMYRPSDEQPIYHNTRGGPTIVARPITTSATLVRDHVSHLARQAASRIGSNRHAASLGARVRRLTATGGGSGDQPERR